MAESNIQLLPHKYEPHKKKIGPPGCQRGRPTSAMVSFSKLCCVNLASSCTTRLDNTSCSDWDFLASGRVAGGLGWKGGKGGGWVSAIFLVGIFRKKLWKLRILWFFFGKFEIYMVTMAGTMNTNMLKVLTMNRSPAHPELSWLPRRLRSVPWRSATVPAKTPPPGAAIRGIAWEGMEDQTLDPILTHDIAWPYTWKRMEFILTVASKNKLDPTTPCNLGLPSSVPQ